jgi:hypothetical protein
MMEMQTYVMLEKPDREQEMVNRGHLDALDETCRILSGLKLCTRYCAGCQIAYNIADAALAKEHRVETWNPSPVIVRR